MVDKLWIIVRISDKNWHNIIFVRNGYSLHYRKIIHLYQVIKFALESFEFYIFIVNYGVVSASSLIRYKSAASRCVKHISRLACKLAQTFGRNGDVKILHMKLSASWTQRVLAGFPCGIPGIGLEIEGAIQQAPQSIRHSIKNLFTCSHMSKQH